MRNPMLHRCGMGALALCLFLGYCVAAHAVSPATTELLNKFPCATAAERDAVCAEAVKLGPDFVLNEALSASSTPVFDAKVQYLLNGMADYVSRPDAEEERKEFAGALVKALANTDAYLKNADETARKENIAFVISLLQNVGDATCVDAVSAFLADERFCDPASRALVTIGSPNAGEALAKALEPAAGASRLTIVQALGELRWKPSLEALTKDALSDDAALRREALFALAKIGDLTSQPILLKMSETGLPHERAEMTGLYLAYAERLAALGKKAESEGICRELMKDRGAPGDAHVRCAALRILAELKGREAVADLLAAFDADDKELRGAALQISQRLAGLHVTEKWVEKLAAVDPERRAEILRMLGLRDDDAALPAINAALKDEDKAVRLAALEAATRCGGSKSFTHILASIDAARDNEETKAVKEALLRVVGEEQVRAVGEKLAAVPAPAKKALLEVLAARRAASEVEAVFAQTSDTEDVVRVAALAALENVAGESDLPRIVDLLINAPGAGETAAAQKTIVGIAKQIEDAEARADVILARYAECAAEKKPVLLPTLPGVAGKRALELVAAETRSSDTAIRDAAVRALAEWPDGAAIPELMTLAKTAQDETQQVLALRGAVRLLGASGMALAEKVQLLKQAMDLAKRPEERTSVLGTLADIRDMESFRVASAYLSDDALKAEAALALAKIACPRDDADKGLTGPEVADALKKASGLIADADMKKKVDAFLAAMPLPDAEGFVPLFNGTDLTGWTGDTAGYVVENGAIVCKPGGNLFTVGEYADFAFKFEFKLTPNANNGIGIRAPLEGNAAYSGMEIQVLDDGGSEYTTLHPYQYHGSIYGVVPCARGHQKPVGEWNSEEIIAKGSHIMVILNGVIIVDADLDKASEFGTIDHNEHPGLKNKSGHIGFLGHGSVVEFRNLRVKELK